MRITSTQNSAVKFVRSLDKASVRRERGEYLIEGVRLVTEAIQMGLRSSLTLVDPELLKRSAPGSAILEGVDDWADRAYEVDERVLRAATQTETPAGIVAVLPLPQPSPLTEHQNDALGLVLDGLADPGNGGTLLRSAAAFGAGYVVATPRTVDLFSPKVVRSAMGAHFRLQLYLGISWEKLRADLPEVPLVAADARRGVPEPEFEWPRPAALVIGSEAAGLSREAEDVINHYVHIPMKPGVESLNAAVAGSILLYQASGLRAETLTLTPEP